MSDKEILQIIKNLESELTREEKSELHTTSLINMSLKEGKGSVINGRNTSNIINIPVKETFNNNGNIDIKDINHIKV